MSLRRTKIILICVGVLVVLMAAVRIWIAIASRDIPPQDFSDLAFPFQNIPAENNAHAWFTAAGEKVVWGAHEQHVADRLRTGDTVEVAEVEAILATNAPALALLRRGLACTACQPPLVTNLQTLGTFKAEQFLDVAKTLSFERHWKTHNGDNAGAVGDCLDLLHFGDMESRQATCLIQFLVAQAAYRMGIGASTKLVSSNCVDDAALQTLDRALQILDIGHKGLPNAMRGDFQFSSGVMEDLRWGRINGINMPNTTPEQMAWWRKHGAPRFLLKPNETRLFFAQGAREGIQNVPRFYRGMTFHNFIRDLELKLGNRWHMLLHGNSVGNLLIAAMYPTIDSIVVQRCCAECDRSGLRLLIACQRYERKNDHLPAKLDDLVPEFIEAVLKDPFDGQPMRYSAERRIVWSVGENLKDDNGSKMDIHGGGEADRPRKMLDYVIEFPPLPKK